MTTKRIMILSGLSMILPATLAAAEQSARQDNSQFLVWAFLGMCALIVIIQLLPVAMLAFGLVKGLLKGKETPAEAHVTVEK